MTQIYSLHIVAIESPDGTTYTLSRTRGIHIVGGAMPLVHSLTWKELTMRLSSVGIRTDQISRAKAELEEKRSTEIRDLSLTDAQIEELGLGNPAA